MFKATVTVGKANFVVLVEVSEPVTGLDVIDKAIVGLAGDHMRRVVKHPSEAVFVDEIEPLQPNEKMAERLETPLANSNWLPGVRIVSIQES